MKRWDSKKVGYWVGLISGAVIVGLLIGFLAIRPVVMKKSCRAKVDKLGIGKGVEGKKYDIRQQLYDQCVRDAKFSFEE